MVVFGGPVRLIIFEAHIGKIVAVAFVECSDLVGNVNSCSL